ncbi:MAG TPA: hypothetical protein VN451_07710, partial [Chitinophagaceae bacterium]|nr:hypothetical protein [Chitinophagaceae bacterium]
MIKRWSIMLAFFTLGFAALSQQSSGDSVITPLKEIGSADTINYDDLFQDFDSFMDSILSPHSYFLASLSVNKGYYSFQTKSLTTLIEPSRKLTYSPTLAYYHKSGIGITGTSSIINDGDNMNLYQLAVTPSFDYLKNKSFATGVSFTRFFTKDSLPFYTSPLENELYGYFTYRKLWLRPTVAASYGWGSRSDYKKRESVIQDLRLRRNGFTFINTEESVSDFSLMLSLRHDFYWLDVLTYNDHIRFTPQITFTSGTQKFGFNQSSSTYATVVRSGSNVLYSTEEIYLDDQIKFQPLSMSLYLRGEYSIKKFFIQPQFAVDYYFPAEKNNFTTL